MKGVRATAQRLLLAESPWTESLASMLSEGRPSFLHRVPAHALTYTHTHPHTYSLSQHIRPHTHTHTPTTHGHSLHTRTRLLVYTCPHTRTHAARSPVPASPAGWSWASRRYGRHTS